MPQRRPPGPPPDTTPPKLKLALSRKTFATSDKLNKVAVEHGETPTSGKRLRNNLKVGTRLSASLSEPAPPTCGSTRPAA